MWERRKLVRKLEEQVGALLAGRNLTLAVAESCTGGLLGSLLTDVPGSSRYFLGGVVAYHDTLKTALLDVPPAVIRQHGAVSAECALCMARGVRSLAGADIALSVTGVAGPDGGTPEKPVGTVYIGMVADNFEKVERFTWEGGRLDNKWHSVEAALQMLLDHLHKSSPHSAATLKER